MINPNDSGGNVEQWLVEVEIMMKKSLARIIDKGGLLTTVKDKPYVYFLDELGANHCCSTTSVVDKAMVDYSNPNPNPNPNPQPNPQPNPEPNHSIIDKAMVDYLSGNTIRLDWIRKWQGQVVLAGNQTMWTIQVEKAIQGSPKEDGEGYEGGMNSDPETMQRLYADLQDALMETVELVRGELTKAQRTSIGALVVLDVHNRDTTQVCKPTNRARVHSGIDSFLFLVFWPCLDAKSGSYHLHTTLTITSWRSSTPLRTPKNAQLALQSTNIRHKTSNPFTF